MSIDMNTITEQDQYLPETNTVKPKTARRHGSCNACRAAKMRCNGDKPCASCRKEKRRPRVCEYTEKARNIAAAREENMLRKRREANSPSEDEQRLKEESKIPRSNSPPVGPAPGPSSDPSAAMHRKISLCAIVEEFIRVRPGVRAREIQNLERIEDAWRKFQALLANPFINTDASLREKVPQLEAWKTELQQIRKQLNHGDLMGAWSSIAALLRKFRSWETFTPHIGDMVITDSFMPAPTQAFLQERNVIYTELVELDCALGFFLGDQSMQHDFDKSRFRPMDDVDSHSEDTIELFTTIRDVLKIDMSSEAGVWEFGCLLDHHETSLPATPLQRMALCITDSETAERQSAKLTSALVFAVMHCRAANIAAHYSQPGVTIPKAEDDSKDIIRDSRLDQSKGITMECNQVKKYAGIALAAFQRLCDIDAEETANSWTRLHSALTAAVLYGVHGLRERSATNSWEPTKAELRSIEKQFVKLKQFNPDCPIFDHAIRILQNCDKQDVKAKKGVSLKKKKAPVEDTDSPMPSDASDGPQTHSSSKESANLRGQKRGANEAVISTSPSELKRRRTAYQDPGQTIAAREPRLNEPPHTTTQLQQIIGQQPIPAGESPVTGSAMSTDYFEVPQQQTVTGHLVQQVPSRRGSNAIYPIPYPYSFHPPLNPDEEYWRQEGYALQYVKDNHSVHYDLVPLNQQQQYMDTSAQFASSFPPYGGTIQNGNVAPMPQFVESAHSQQPILSNLHMIPEYDSTLLHGHTVHMARTEAESLQQVLSSPPGGPIQAWTSSTDTSPTVYQPQMPHPGLSRRSSEPVWQVNGQYNFPSQGYPYPNPQMQAHHTTFYDSRQHYPALENINTNQHHYHPYPEDRVTTP